MADVQTKTTNATGVMPILTVDDLQKSTDFFTGLGFEVDERWEENGVLLGVMLKAGAVRLGVNQDDGKKGRDRVKGVGMRLIIEVTDDVDSVAARARTAGITLTREPHDTEWGTRAFEVKEPSGFLLTVTSPDNK